MRIGIVPHIKLDNVLEFSENIIDHLAEEEIIITEELGEKLDRNGISIEEMEVDTVVTIGGDGTVLYTLQKLPNTPILGINMGKRGFLADVKPEEAFKALDQLRRNNLEIIEMEKLAVEVSGEKFGEALNEGVIRSAKPTHLVSFKVILDGELIEQNDGDGLIISTQTGSTAYSMAAGGPIIDPRVKANIVVTLSTHRAKTLPLVYPTSSKLEVELGDMKGKAEITLDGQITEKVEEGDVLTFTQAENKAKFYKWKRKFYERIREKL